MQVMVAAMQRLGAPREEGKGEMRRKWQREG